MSEKTPERVLAEAQDKYNRAKADLARARDAYYAANNACDAAHMEYLRVREAYVRDRKPAAQGGCDE